MGKSKIDLLIVGRIPPPVGGVSIHLQRLCYMLDAANIRYKLSYHKPNILMLFRDILQHSKIHVNLSNKALRCIIVLFSRLVNKKVYVTFHGRYNFRNIFDRFALKLAHQVFVLNNYSKEIGDKCTSSSRVHKISAFIPPSEEELTLNTLEDSILSFVKNEKWISVFCTNAHSLVYDNEGLDLYGIDMLINIFNLHPDRLLIVSDPSSNLSKHYGESSDNILFIKGMHSFVQVISISDTFIRATSTDGDSLSVKEAIYLNKNVIASDCVDRPDGCILFITRDIKSLESAISESLLHRGSDSASKVNNGGEYLVNFFSKN